MSDMSQREYWESLSRSFDKRFIDKARREYDPRTRPMDDPTRKGRTAEPKTERS